MSYEGMVEALCSNGHLNHWDCYDEQEKCEVCGAKFVWENHIDQTNGDYGSVWAQDMLTLISPGVYEIPKDSSRKATLRKYWDKGYNAAVQELAYSLFRDDPDMFGKVLGFQLSKGEQL